MRKGKALTDNGRSLLILLVLSSVIVFFLLISAYIPAIILAVIISRIFMPLHKRFLKITKQKQAIATSLSMIVIFLSVIVPSVIVGSIIFVESRDLARASSTFLIENDGVDGLVSAINESLEKLPFNVDPISKEQINIEARQAINNISEFVLEGVLNFSASAISLFTQVFVFLILLGTLLNKTDNVYDYIKKTIPLPNKIIDMYLEKITKTATSVFKGLFIVSTIQGVAAGVVLYVLGIDYVVLWTILMIILSILPVGAGLVTIPLAIVMIISGNVIGGVFLILWTLIVVNNLDNYLRPKLISGDVKLPESLSLLSILGGLGLFGFMGLIYGPIIVIFMLTTLEVYRTHRDELSDPSKVSA